MPLDVQIQSDFSGGSFQSPSRELIPKNGFAKAVNALLEEDGAIYRRGGSAYVSSSDFPANLTFLWDGYLTAGHRTVFASASSYGVLASDNTTNVSLGGTGTDGQRPAAGNGLLFVPNGASGSTGAVTVYGGATKATYATGTLTTTSGSATVTGSGSAWAANLESGMLLTSGGNLLGVVKTVDTNTQVTLRDPARSVVTAATYSAAATYAFSPIGALRVDAVATVSNPARLVVASGDTIWFSAAGDPFTFNLAAVGGDYHKLPQGAQVTGMEALRNVLFAYSTQGIFTITGMDFDLTDALGNVQQRLDQINRDIVLWDARGIAGTRGALVVPAVDDVYLVTDSAAPQVLSGPIRALYRSYVAAGYQTGFGGVYRSHYFLPILNGNTWVDTLVCRMDQGGWTFLAGHGGTSVGFTQRSAGNPTRQPQLLSAGGRRILDLSGIFTPTFANKNDADGTTHVFSVITRDFTTGGLRKNLVKKIRLRYDLNDAGTDDPTIEAYYSSGQVVTGNPLWGGVSWGSFTWGPSSDEQFAALTLPQAHGPEGTSVTTWQVLTTETGVRPRFARFKFQSSSPCSKLVIRSLEMFVRSGGRQ